jgi:hypothetical protein
LRDIEIENGAKVTSITLGRGDGAITFTGLDHPIEDYRDEMFNRMAGFLSARDLFEDGDE